MRIGVDLSNWNGAITGAQTKALAADGVQFAYVLLTDGASFRNPDATEQAAALRGAGIHVGFYHFLRPDATNADQILDFITMAHGCGGTKLPLALDSETADVNGWADLAGRMASFARQIAGVQTDVTNTRSMIYCNGSFANNLPGVPWGNWLWFADPSNTQPTRTRLITQLAPRPVATLPNKTDYDIFNGTDADWAAFTGEAPQPAPGPEPVDVNTLSRVPGYGIPGAPEVVILGQMQGGGVYRGCNVAPGVTVYAGTGSPTVFHSGFNAKALPAGTPLACLLTQLESVVGEIVTEQL